MYWTAHTFPNDSYFEDISGAAALGLKEGTVPSRQTALAVLRRAVETDPMYFSSFYQLGRIGYEDGADSKRLAEQDLEKAVALMTDRMPVADRTMAHHYLGRIRADRGDYDAAYEEFDAAIKGSPGDVWPYIRWSEALIARIKKENDEELQVSLRLDAAGHMMRAVALS